MKKNLKKYLIRILFGVFIFLFFHFTRMEDWHHMATWNKYHYIQLVFVMLTVLLIWGVGDLVTIFFEKRYGREVSTKPRLVQLFLVCTLLTLPMILAASYFSVFYLDVLLMGSLCENPITQFWQTSLKAEVLMWIVIGSEMLKIYYKHAKQIEHERALMQKELLVSQFQTLKNQVNPHFLFNSFSVLATLIDEDPPKAAVFLNRLSKMYRYILDHGEASLVSLHEELQFLEDYLYLLKTRHEDSILVDLKICDKATDLYLPTLSLQMLVENAVKHNNFSVHNPLLVDIYQEGDSYLVVQNRLNDKKQRNGSTHIGLENVRKRFDLHAGKKVLVDHNDAYFTVKIPLLSDRPPLG